MRKLQKRTIVTLVLVLIAAAAVTAVAASQFFVEPEVEVLATLYGEDPNTAFGWVAEDLGDINGDGISDLITSDPFLGGGKIYVYSGADFTLLNSAADVGSGLFGYSATLAGDVNADGVPDYVAGGPGGSGIAIVYSGADHTVIRQWTGQEGESFGASVAGAGDVNGDGYGDILVGATAANEAAGRVDAYSGKDGSLLWSRSGKRPQDFLGSAVGLVGDVNGDHVPDQVAGARAAGWRDRGEAYVLSGVNGATIHTLRPLGPAGDVPTFATFHASGAGDINRDGVPDVYIGDYNARGGRTREELEQDSGTGRAYLFDGASGRRLYVFEAEALGDGFGPGRGIGDVNGDGFGDVFIGAYTSSAGAVAGGKGYVYSVRDRAVLRTMTGSQDFQFLGVDALDIQDVNGDGLRDYILTGFNVLHVIAGTPLP